jgi:hypothetical protein
VLPIKCVVGDPAPKDKGGRLAPLAQPVLGDLPGPQAQPVSKVPLGPQAQLE